ncbi:HupE/UreJ family protein [Foetidibacter luteolus]|uniref:HupE/UreJ family protein n=1 Tax=Foetidibacter luteolus TaxID=2608880 RepID=UPI00129B7A48|nr:HupE/UreJ family protein [Foetidibacter luteolus]
MNDFWIFFPTGIEHITDLNGIDHILFVAVLCLRYTYKDWRKILVLVTAFTIGHSVTLALSTLEIFSLPSRWTEFLIPVTIIVTAVSNFFVNDFSFRRKFPAIYFYALFFGFIHGMGFSTLLKSMLGKDQSIWLQLLAFNLGLEAGQLLIVLVILFISFIFVHLFSINRKYYILFVSVVIAVLALQMAIERSPLNKENNDEKTALINRRNDDVFLCRRTEHPKQSGLQPR